MQTFRRFALPFTLAALAGGIGQAAQAQSASTPLSGYQEVPAVSTPATGKFSAKLLDGSISYTLKYSGVASGVTQAHIHFGQAGVNGGISVFLCSNLDADTAGTQACPAGDAVVTGTITAADVLGPSGQGITAGNLDALIAAANAGALYANVHSVTFPGGEIRGQLKPWN